MKSERGFTIVELLIVIVVIAILAAITIVAYNGIQNRAKNTAAQESASQLRTKVEAYNTIKGAYPAAVSNLTEYDETKLDAGLSGKVASSATVNETTPVYYAPCSSATGTKGGVVTYWQASGTSPLTITVGAAC